MAIYDYYCPKCESEKEIIHPMSESPEILCDECGEKMKIAIKNANFQLKGMGWVSKGNGTASKPIHTVEKGVAVPSYLKDTVNKEATLGSHT